MVRETHDLLSHIVLRAPHEVDFAEEHLVEEDAKSPHIHTRAVILRVEELWSHIRVGAKVRLVQLLLRRKPEIPQLVDSLAHEDVFRLDIPVQHLVRADEIQRIRHLVQNEDCLVLGQLLLRPQQVQ